MELGKGLAAHRRPSDPRHGAGLPRHPVAVPACGAGILAAPRGVAAARAAGGVAAPAGSGALGGPGRSSPVRAERPADDPGRDEPDGARSHLRGPAGDRGRWRPEQRGVPPGGELAPDPLRRRSLGDRAGDLSLRRQRRVGAGADRRGVRGGQPGSVGDPAAVPARADLGRGAGPGVAQRGQRTVAGCRRARFSRVAVDAPWCVPAAGRHPVRPGRECGRAHPVPAVADGRARIRDRTGRRPDLRVLPVRRRRWSGGGLVVGSRRSPLGDRGAAAGGALLDPGIPVHPRAGGSGAAAARRDGAARRTARGHGDDPGVGAGAARDHGRHGAGCAVRARGGRHHRGRVAGRPDGPERRIPDRGARPLLGLPFVRRLPTGRFDPEPDQTA